MSWKITIENQRNVILTKKKSIGQHHRKNHSSRWNIYRAIARWALERSTRIGSRLIFKAEGWGWKAARLKNIHHTLPESVGDCSLSCSPLKLLPCRNRYRKSIRGTHRYTSGVDGLTCVCFYLNCKLDGIEDEAAAGNAFSEWKEMFELNGSNLYGDEAAPAGSQSAAWLISRRFSFLLDDQVSPWK